MATMQPALGRCPERLKLMDAFDFEEACRELINLHNAEISALISGQTVERSEMALTRARKKRDEAKQAILHHTSMHRCN